MTERVRERNTESEEATLVEGTASSNRVLISNEEQARQTLLEKHNRGEELLNFDFSDPTATARRFQTLEK